MTNGHPPRMRQGFVKISSVRCSACEDRGALTNAGHPIKIATGTKSTGCELCGGRGEISVEGEASLDPYSRRD